MINIEKKIEMRGIPRNEIINYFSSLDGENIGCGKFKGQDWEVEISKESLITLGSLEIYSIIVSFACEKERLEKMIIAFRLKFLSAGG